MTPGIRFFLASTPPHMHVYVTLFFALTAYILTIALQRIHSCDSFECAIIMNGVQQRVQTITHAIMAHTRDMTLHAKIIWVCLC